MITDTSRPGWDNPAPNIGMFSEVQPSIYLVPRRPTNLFYDASTPAEWVGQYNDLYALQLGPQTFEDSGGFAIDFDANIGLTNWYTQLTPSWRAAPTYSVSDNVTLLRGKHSLTFGGSALISNAKEYAQTMVPSINLRFNTLYNGTLIAQPVRYPSRGQGVQLTFLPSRDSEPPHPTSTQPYKLAPDSGKSIPS